MNDPIQNSNDAGTSMLEYAFLALLILVVAIGAVTFLGTSTSGQFSQISSAFPDQ